MYADLHLHSCYSDGTFTPEEIVRRAQRQGLGAIALTDHDTVEGCAVAAAECAAAGIEFVIGTELTAEHADHELHLLAYFIDPTNPALRDEINKFQQVRQERIRKMVAHLNELGVPLPVEEVFALANCKSPGRPHVARALVQQEFCHTLDEAFERYLKKGRPAWVPKARMDVLTVIQLVRQAGGLVVLAHPGLNKADELIPELVSAGLDGIECFHTKHSAPVAQRYLGLAQRYHLLVTGGSDCHGMGKRKPLIGTVRLARADFDRFKAAAEQRKRTQQTTPAAPA